MSSDVFHSPHQAAATGANPHRAGSARMVPGPLEGAETDAGQEVQRANHGLTFVSDPKNLVEKEKPEP
jgi:hypothetical protein